MTSSKPSGIRQVPPPTGGKEKPASAYSRFIPREELDDYAAWTPGAFGDLGGSGAASGGSKPQALLTITPQDGLNTSTFDANTLALANQSTGAQQVSKCLSTRGPMPRWRMKVMHFTATRSISPSA